MPSDLITRWTGSQLEGCQGSSFVLGYVSYLTFICACQCKRSRFYANINNPQRWSGLPIFLFSRQGDSVAD